MFLVLVLFLTVWANPRECTGECQTGATESELMMEEMVSKRAEWARCRSDSDCMFKITAPLATAPTPGQFNSRVETAIQYCKNGISTGYPCKNVDLVGWLSLNSLANCTNCPIDVAGNDMWGWVDPSTGIEYALMGLTIGVCLVRVGPPPRILGFIPNHGTEPSPWRDIKVYRDVAYIVSESPQSKMQFFDLFRLRTLSEGWKLVQPDGLYDEFDSAHNLAMNIDTGFVYATGSTTCAGGLHMINLSQPMAPKFAGCFSQDGYIHDAQCVVYHGPDDRFTDREICFCFAEDSVTIADVTVKSAPVMLSRTGYAQVSYTHQGWLTPDMKHLFVGDEQDEWRARTPNRQTRTLVFDVSLLTSVQLANTFLSSAPCIDHNMYYKDGFLYQANYEAGMRVLDVSDVFNIREAAYYDVVPRSQTVGWHGAWTVYPFFPSNNVIISTIEQGMFIVLHRSTLSPTTSMPTRSPTAAPTVAEFSACDGNTGMISFTLPNLRQSKFVLSVPSGVIGLSLRLNAPLDADLMLYDVDSSEPIVGCSAWLSTGALCTASSSSTRYKGTRVTYSGYKDATETVTVDGPTVSSMGVSVSVFGASMGQATLDYSYTSKQDEWCLGRTLYGSSMMKSVKAKETILLTMIPSGVSAEIHMFSTSDLDLQLFDKYTGNPIFACGRKPVSSCFKQAVTTAEGHKYSGWGGVPDNPGKEFLKIAAANSPLLVKLFGQTAGSAVIDYIEERTHAPSFRPTRSPSTRFPSLPPSLIPSVSPTSAPTTSPTASPVSNSPTFHPTPGPTTSPTASPVSNSPTFHPTPGPTTSPTASPVSNSPTTISPTVPPTSHPIPPTTSPTTSPVSTTSPTIHPTPVPTTSPTHPSVPAISPTIHVSNPSA